jgi:hypothetical protein
VKRSCNDLTTNEELVTAKNTFKQLRGSLKPFSSNTLFTNNTIAIPEIEEEYNLID